MICGELKWTTKTKLYSYSSLLHLLSVCLYWNLGVGIKITSGLIHLFSKNLIEWNAFLFNVLFVSAYNKHHFNIFPSDSVLCKCFRSNTITLRDKLMSALQWHLHTSAISVLPYRKSRELNVTLLQTN